VLLDFLRTPEAYQALGLPAERVEVIETHHAWVFLLREHVLKMKKPVHTRWLDFSTPAQRKAACNEELRVNRALAPGVYLGLVQASWRPSGWVLRPIAEGKTQAETDLPYAATADSAEGTDWMVLMRRLPAERMLDQLILQGTVSPEGVDRLAHVLCAFWAGAPRASLTPQAWQERAAQTLAENERGLLPDAWALPNGQAGRWAAAVRQVETALEGCRRLQDGCARELAQRVAQGRMVCGHGDLRPEHVHLPPPPARPLVIDRLEFSENLRQVDPFEELSYLAVECRRLGAAWVGRRLFARGRASRWPTCRTAQRTRPGAGAIWRFGTWTVPRWLSLSAPADAGRRWPGPSRAPPTPPEAEARRPPRAASERPARCR